MDKKSLETVFSIAICRQLGDKWHLKTLFLTSINFFDCSLSGVISLGVFCGNTAQAMIQNYIRSMRRRLQAVTRVEDIPSIRTIFFMIQQNLSFELKGTFTLAAPAISQR